MYRKLPVITVTAEELRQRMRQERNAKKRTRLQMLYLLVTIAVGGTLEPLPCGSV